MTKRLDGKIALVNGGGSSGPGWGNGKATAVQFAREGAKVVVLDVNRAAAQDAADIIAKEGGTAVVVEADVTSEADMKRAVGVCLSTFGRLDILMHVVGVSGKGSFLTQTTEDWHRSLAINLDGAFFAARAAIPPMLEQKSGRIITVSSIAGIRFLRRGAPYSYGVTKAGLVHLTRMLAYEYAPHGIRANCITLGMMNTPMATVATGEAAAKFAALRDKGSPTGKQGTGWDTAHAAVFLASEEGNYVNGLELVLDGGLTGAAPQIYPEPV